MIIMRQDNLFKSTQMYLADHRISAARLQSWEENMGEVLLLKSSWFMITNDFLILTYNGMFWNTTSTKQPKHSALTEGQFR